MSATDGSATIPLVIDIKSGRPACVLIQAAYGCRSALVSRHFDPQTWLTFPTDDMRKVPGTPEQWATHGARINAEFGRDRASLSPSTVEAGK